VCSPSQSGGGANTRLLTLQLESRDRDARILSFVRLALKAVMKNDGASVDIILLYSISVSFAVVQNKNVRVNLKKMLPNF
jgi:hypothetical protein